MVKKLESAVVYRDGVWLLCMDGGHEASISAEDVAAVKAHHWHVSKRFKGKGVYVTTFIGGKIVNLNNFLTGMKPRANTPHRNGNDLDFRRENLDTLAASISVNDGTATMKVVSHRNSYDVLFDEGDIEKVMALGCRWSVMRSGYVYNGKMYFHRFLLDADKNTQVDHLNHNKLDNRRVNLAVKSPSENSANRPSAFAAPGRFAKEKNPYAPSGQRRSRSALPSIVTEGDKGYLPLTQGQRAIVDIADATELGESLWHATWNEDKRSFYARRSGRSGPYLHQVIMGTWKAGNSVHVDHINGNTLDCRRSNLRVTTPGQNAQNRGPGRNSKTGVRNVYRHEATKMLEVKVMARGKGYYGGFYPDTPDGLTEATEAARLLREKLFTHSDGR